jgi:Uma2 family endonuclease
MTLLSLTPPARPRLPVQLSSDPEELWDLAERLNGRPVPGVRMTERQFVDWCPAQIKAEWVDGEVILVPTETPGHNKRELFIGRVVAEFVERLDLGTVFLGTVPVRLPVVRRRRIPDVVFVAATRTHIIGDTEINGAPDLIIEVVSPDSVSRDWVDKRDDYQRAGAREYWIVDPRHEQFAAYALHGKTYRAIHPDAQGRVPSRVLKGLYIRPAWLWRSPLPKVATVLKELGVR